MHYDPADGSDVDGFGIGAGSWPGPHAEHIDQVAKEVALIAPELIDAEARICQKAPGLLPS